MSGVLDLDEVRHELTAERVLDHYQFPTRRAGRDELVARACPRRADHSRRAFLINVDTGRWRCYPCNIGGDALRLVAEFERLSDKTEFPAVLAKAAEIAGVGPHDLPEEERHRRREARRLERERAEQARRAERTRVEAAAVPRATSYWGRACDRRNAHGEAYLDARGVGAALRFDLIRFDRRLAGSPAIALHTRDGKIRNVVRRLLPDVRQFLPELELEDDTKVIGLRHCPSAGTLVNAVSEIEIVRRDVVVTEGVFDSITAALAWRKAIVLGAHGAGNLPSIVRAAAPHVAKIKTRLVLVPHDDKAGYQASKEACKAAQAAGLSVIDGTLHIEKTGAKDLNEAWLRGWRPAS